MKKENKKNLNNKSVLGRLNETFTENLLKRSGIVYIWLGFILFVMVVFVSYIGQYIAERTVSHRELTWNYAMQNSVDTRVDDAEWRTYTGPGTVEVYVNKTYIHLQRTFPHSTEDRILYFYTDYAPNMVRINNSTVYDVSFETAEYVGNQYNAVKIPASARDQQVDIFIKHPYSSSFSAYMEVVPEGAKVDAGFSWNAVLWVGAAVILVAIVIFIFALVEKIRYRHGLKMVLSALTAFLAGIHILLLGLSRSTYYFNGSIWTDVRMFFGMSIFASVAFNTVTFHWKKAKPLILLSIYVLSLFAMLAPVSLQIHRYIFIGNAAIGSALLLVLIFDEIKNCRERIQFATYLITVCTTAVLSMIAYTVISVFSSQVEFTYAEVVLVIIASIVFFICTYKRFVVSAVQQEKTGDIMKLYESWMSNENAFTDSLIETKSLDELAECVVRGLVGLIRNAEETGNFNSADELRAVAGIDDNGVIRDSFRLNLDEPCNYEAIIRYTENTGKTMVVGDGYCEMIFFGEGRPKAVFHFENTENEMGEFLYNLLVLNYPIIDAEIHRLYSPEDTEQYRIDSFMRLADNIEQKTGSTQNHLSNVEMISTFIAEEMGVPEEEIPLLAHAAKLHDIGKLAIPIGILNKRDILDKNERAIINSHTRSGYVMLSSFKDEFFNMASQIALGHHVNANGKYPEEMDEIGCRNAKIVQVADVYDALTTKRSYKDAWSTDQAFKYIISYSGFRFDKAVVDAMVASKDRIEEFKRGI